MNTQRYVTAVVFLTGILVFGVFATPSTARTPNFVDQSDSFISYGLGYEYTEGKFIPTDGSTSNDTTIGQSLSTAHLSVRPTYFTQFYGLVGLERNNLGGTTTERGTVTGGGGQIVLDYNKDLYLKAVGSFQLHEELDVNGTNQSTEITQDWQGGFLLGRSVRRSSIQDYVTAYDAYMGVLYSDRRAEITEGGTTEEFEMSEANGGSIFAGLNWRYSRALRVKLEAEAGAMTSGSFRLSYTF